VATPRIHNAEWKLKSAAWG